MLTLKKSDGAADMAGIQKLEVGISWDTSKNGLPGFLGRISQKLGTNLDLVATLRDEEGNPVRFVGIDSLEVDGGSIRHSGDNKSGKGDGDDETVTMELDRVSGNVHSIILSAVAYQLGSSFDRAENVSLKVYDSTGGSKDQVADIWPSLTMGGNAVAIAKVTRTNGAWELEVLNKAGRVDQGDRMSLLRFGRYM